MIILRKAVEFAVLLFTLNVSYTTETDYSINTMIYDLSMGQENLYCGNNESLFEPTLNICVQVFNGFGKETGFL